jgi:hypothetical protein
MKVGLLPEGYRRVALTGWVLYALSWVTPAADATHIGAWAFLAAPRFAVSLLEASTVSAATVAVCLLLGWLANFSIFLRWPAAARAAWIVAPWLPFVSTQLFVHSRPDVLYFYPWAVGIAAIHGAHIVGARKNNVTNSPR